MTAASTTIAYKETGFYSRMILDYLQGEDALKPFYTHPVSTDGIKAAIESRKAFSTNRKLLVDILQKHYTGQKVTNKQQLKHPTISKCQLLYGYYSTSAQYFYRSFIFYL